MDASMELQKWNPFGVPLGVQAHANFSHSENVLTSEYESISIVKRKPYELISFKRVCTQTSGLSSNYLCHRF